jgi:CHASE2 domain-containing sensor protein
MVKQREGVVQVFISSPGDVGEERRRAAIVVRRLKREFQWSFDVKAVLWEFETMLAQGHFQDIVEKPSDSEIFVMVLWSRIGTPLPEDRYHGIDGRKPVTGTEWEFEDALASYEKRGVPDLIVYRKTAPPDPRFSGVREVSQELREIEHQWRKLEEFWLRYFETNKGYAKRAYNLFTTADEFESKLETALRDLLEKRAARGGSFAPKWRAGSPYRGLSAFETDHSQIFFGRGRAEREVIEAWTRSANNGCAFLLILGASGVGKSSLVQAGVLPTLVEPGVVRGVNLWRRCILRPGLRGNHDLFAYMAVALVEQADSLPELSELGISPIEFLTAHLRDAPAQVPEVLKLGLNRAKRNSPTRAGQPRLIVAIDQLEELFAVSERREQAGFVAALDALACCGFVWIIATMRSDYYAQLGNVPRLADLASAERQYLLVPPRPAEIRQMIREPAALAGVSFEKDEAGIGLDDILQEVMVGEPGALPLLEFALDELYRMDVEEERRHQMTFGSYAALGSLEGAIAARAEAVCRSLDEPEERALTAVLLALISADEVASADRGTVGSTLVARTIPRAEVATTPEREQILERLVAARLIIAAGLTVRIAHEALIAHWPRLQQLVREYSALIELRDRLARERAVWERECRSTEFLIPAGARLREAEALLRKQGDHLDPATSAFIQSSLDADLKTRDRENFRRCVTTAARKVLEIGDSKLEPDDPQLAALRQAETVRELVRAILGGTSNIVLWEARLGAANEALGDACRAIDDRSGAAAAYRDAAASGERQIKDEPDNPDRLRALLGILQKEVEVLPPTAAEPVLRRSIEVTQRLGKTQPNILSAQPKPGGWQRALKRGSGGRRRSLSSSRPLNDPSVRRTETARMTSAYARLRDSPLFWGIVWAQAIWASILLLWVYGGLQPFELLVYDALRVAWAGHERSTRIFLVGATEDDIKHFGWPLRDGELADLLERLASWRPQVIGVNLYRDFPRPPGSARLDAVLAGHKEIVWVFGLPTKSYSSEMLRGVPPPEALRGTDRAVFSDFLSDPGNVIRRALLYADDGKDQYTALAMEVALRYLAAEHIHIMPGADEQIILGKTTLSPLEDARGPYTLLDGRGYQVLIDYKGGPNPFQIKSIGEIMHSDDVAPLVTGRVVLVGITSESVRDSVSTPFNTGFYKFGEEQMNGIVVHAHIADQLIREALNGGPVLGGLLRRHGALFFWFWCVAGALVGAVLNTWVRVASVVAAGLCALGLVVYSSFGWGLWLPGLPAALGWAFTAGGTASWQVAMNSRLRRQARELRQVRLLASGRQLLLLVLMQQTDASADATGTGDQHKILHELITALTTVDPGKLDWADG